jgi:four helix bundle protein
MRDHRKLRAFQLADELALAIYEETVRFPRCELFGLTSQLRRGAVRVPSTIVEGCARTGQVEHLRFLEMAHASTREIDYQVSLAARLGYLDDRGHRRLGDLVAETARCLHGLLHAFRPSGSRLKAQGSRPK